jgi:peptide/nickel transport system substrate-binding protein
MKYLMAPQ